VLCRLARGWCGPDYPPVPAYQVKKRGIQNAQLESPAVDDVYAQTRLQSYLQPGEKVLWTGRPDPGRLLSSKDAYLIPFSLMWGGFAIVWEGGVLLTMAGANGAPIFFALWGIPFVVAGQYLIWGRFLVKRWDRRRTVYAVTDQRVLVLRGASLQSMFVSSLPGVTQSARPDGSGSLEFGSSSPFGSGVWANTGMDLFNMGRTLLAFYDIPNVAQVDRLINESRKGHQS